MADGGRQMSFTDIRTQVFNLARLAGGDKVSEVVSFSIELLDDIEVLVVGDAVRVTFLHEVTIAAVEYNADFVAVLLWNSVFSS